MKALIAVMAVLLPVAAFAAEETDATAAEDQIAAVKAVEPSVVIVEYELQYDKGAVEGRDSYRRSAEKLIAEERPMEVDGFLLKPTLVITPDIAPHPRFVKTIRVRHGEQTVEAAEIGYLAGYDATLLELARPLPGTKPLEFIEDPGEGCLNICYDLRQEGWRVLVSRFSANAVVPLSGPPYIESNSYSVITAPDGRPVGLSMCRRLPADGSWKGSPLKWQSVSADEMQKLLADLKRNTDACMLRTKLNFRSPKARPGDRYSQYGGFGDDATLTEQDAISLLVEPQKALVLSNLQPKATARLERITLFTSDDTPVSARFAHTLKDYGCFLAELETPLPEPARISAEPVGCRLDELMLSADVSVQGDKRVAYLDQVRILGYNIGWQRRVYPEIRGDSDNIFMFDLQQRLVALPVARRRPASSDRWSREGTPLTPAAFLLEALHDLPETADASNVPLSEADENRLAWIGVEMQALNPELARANNVSDFTSDGKTGALVSFVYTGSPAEAAGVQPGWILLRAHVEGEPKPVEVKLEEYVFDRVPFPWDKLDQLPEQYYDQIPKPWPPVENSFTRALTDLGFGRSFTAEFIVDGEKTSKQFSIVESPPHFDSAPYFAAEDLGITLRDMTYEVRRYFQKRDDEPGVIVSKIEPGSRGSVAGIKPYEIITHVNDQPATDVQAFEKLYAGKGELKLSVRRMTRGRIVPIKMDTAEKPAAEPEE